MSLRFARVPAAIGLSLALACGALAADGAAPSWHARCADGERIEFQDALAKGPVVVSFW